MLVSVKWLADYIDISDLSDEKLAEILTDLGLEVERIDKVKGVDPNVVVGEVIEAEQHPDADSLRVCKVSVNGSEEPLNIVCGAPNARRGIKVAVAQIGAVLPGDFKIKPTKIRGVKSQGMMCSGKELTISDDHEGIIELDASNSVGKKVDEIFDISDTVLEIGLTPNRSDCNGYLGIARDLGAKLNRPVKLPTPIAPSDYAGNESCDKSVTIRINNDEICPRFVAIYATNITVCQSPAWMQKRLEAAGMRPINLIVDVTNYVMLEQNQPIHAYDERFVAGNTIEVREATIKDKLVTLDEQEQTLVAGDILICDAEKPIGLAGIMGGANSEVKDDTTSIIVEVANFPESQIRKTSKRLGLHTEASHRFERGLDRNNLESVARRVTDLISKCCVELGVEPPHVSSDVIDSKPEPFKNPRIALRLDRAKRLLGISSLSLENCIDCLKRLNFHILDHTENRVLVEAPSFRVDIEREVDLIEEVGRLYGYEKVPYTLPTMQISPNYENPLIAFESKTRSILAGFGLAESMVYPFASLSEYEKLGIGADHPLGPSVELQNPLSEEFNYLQFSQVPVLLRALRHAKANGTRGSKVFQIGRGFSLKDRSVLNPELYQGAFKNLKVPCDHFTPKAKLEETRPIEKVFASIVLDSPCKLKDWRGEEELPNFFTAKQIFTQILDSFGIKELSYKTMKENEVPFLNPGRSAMVVDAEGQAVAWMGELHPRMAFNLGFPIKKSPVILEINLETLFEQTSNMKSIDSTQRKFPPALRDIAIQVKQETTHQEIAAAISGSKKNRFISDFSLFDVYEGENVEAGQKSMAYTLTFKAKDKTLTDKEVDKEVRLLLEYLNNELGATQR